jgi:hypothetical protein
VDSLRDKKWQSIPGISVYSKFTIHAVPTAGPRDSIGAGELKDGSFVFK